MSKHYFASVSLALGLSFSVSSYAAPVIGVNPFGPDSAVANFDLGESAGTVIGNQYASAGVSFGGPFYFAGNPGPYSGIANFSGGHVDNFSGGGAESTYTISFAAPVYGAGSYWEFNSETSATFTAFRGGSVVESFDYFNESCCDSASFLGFAGIVFDKIQISNITGTYFIMDNLHVAPVPVPAAVWAFGSGLIGLMGVRRRHSKLAR